MGIGSTTLAKFIQFHQVVLLAPHGMYLNDYKEV